MPGFDGTGPRGMGPMTGGGRGFCSPWGMGRRMGFGRGVGFGRGYGFGGAMPYQVPGQSPAYGAPYGYPSGVAGYPGATMTREQELDSLKSEAEMVKGQLEQISARISELEKGEG